MCIRDRLHIGRHTFISPVVLAPMAGITNRAFRRLCRQYGDAGLDQSGGAGSGEPGAAGASGATSLYVSEMITSRALVERTPTSMPVSYTHLRAHETVLDLVC